MELNDFILYAYAEENSGVTCTVMQLRNLFCVPNRIHDLTRTLKRDNNTSNYLPNDSDCSLQAYNLNNSFVASAQQVFGDEF